MRGFGTCFIAGLFLGVAINFVGPLAESYWDASGVIPTAKAQPVAAIQTVDRTNKSDRLPSGPMLKSAPGGDTAGSGKPVETARPIPVGCEPAFSPLSAARAIIFPNRCLA